MYVTTLIVAHLDYDGCMRIFEMRARPGSPITIARADEFDEPHSGPFHFLDGQDRDTFEKGFAECKRWKLSESDFTLADGMYRFRTSWEGIPTERNSLSCYSLLLPECAVPVEIRFNDPHSGREYSKSVIRDNRHKCFVAYLECRSSYGSFDFQLEARFRNDESNFRSANYTDEHTTRPGAHVHPYKRLVPTASWPLVQRFLSLKPGSYQPVARTDKEQVESEPLQLSFAGIPSQLEVTPLTLISANRVEVITGHAAPQSTAQSKESKQKISGELPPRKQDLSNYFDSAKLTEKQRTVLSLKYEYELGVSAIAQRLKLNRKTVDEHIDAAEKKLQQASSKYQRARKNSEHPE